MKENKDILLESRMLMGAGRWFWRLILVYLLFNWISIVLTNLPSALMDTSADAAVLESAKNDPSRLIGLLKDKSFILRMGILSAFTLFLSAIARGATNIGSARVLIKSAAHHQGQGWFKGALAGFKDPFGAFSLFILSFARIWWTTIFIVAPSLVCFVLIALKTGEAKSVFLAPLPLSLLAIKPFYRFRQIWFVKARNPELNAWQVMKESDRLMEGNKMKLFKLDCLYWKIVLLLAFLVFVSFCMSLLPQNPLVGFMDLAVFALSLYLVLFLNVYWDIGLAVFFREISCAAGQAQRQEPCANTAIG